VNSASRISPRLCTTAAAVVSEPEVMLAGLALSTASSWSRTVESCCGLSCSGPSVSHRGDGFDAGRELGLQRGQTVDEGDDDKGEDSA
jgi:hypothetical protein